MAEEASFPAGQRLSDDLRRIRKDRGVSIDEIHTETRIARTLIESFEEGELYDHPTYNRVYLRSFIKAYADAVQISREQALNALDAALSGTYQHGLAQEYLSGESSEGSSEAEESRDEDGSPSPSSESTTDGPTAGGPEGRGGIVGPPRAVGEEPAEDEISMDDPPDNAATKGASAPSTAGESGDEGEEEREEASSKPPTRDDDKPDASSNEAEERTDDSDGLSGDDEQSESPPEKPEESATGTPDPAPMGEDMETGIVGEPTEMGSGGGGAPSGPAQPSGGREASPASSSTGFADLFGDGNRRIILSGVGIAVVCLVLVGLGVAYFSSGEGGTSGEGEPNPAPADTATVRTSPASPDTSATASPDTGATSSSVEQPPPPANVTLGETIHLLVLATDNVSGIRIQRDDDLRRPYWIEEGEASVYPFQRRAIIGSEFEDIRLFVEGYEYPFAPADTTGGLELDRETLQAFVDTLRGAPDSLAVTPDTIPVGPIEGAPPAPEDTTLDDTLTE
jgi:hypothetical protein